MAKFVTTSGLARFYTKISSLFALKSHTHIKSQITDMPTKLSQFVNDVGFKTTDTTYGLATTNTNGLMSYSDKSKLNGVAYGANNYTHPSTHPASIISTDSTHRFVTDSQISTWNNKAGKYVATTNADGLMSASDKKKVDGIASTTKTITIAASDWQDGYYTLFDPLITSATSNQEWMEPLATDSNKAMRDMLCAANLKDVAQGVGWTKVRCEGTVPTSSVEVRICFRGEK